MSRFLLSMLKLLNLKEDLKDLRIRRKLMETKPDIYAQVLAAGIEHDHHETDLYTPVNDETKKLIDAYHFRGNVTTFTSQIDGKPWYDIPFAFTPGWPKSCR